jgi:ethanolamine permease
VFAAMLSYISRAAAFLVLRWRHADLHRPFVSPFGSAGAWLTIAICVVTLFYQLRDAAFVDGVFWVVVWVAVGIAYFLTVARHRLVLSPEEQAALARR